MKCSICKQNSFDILCTKERNGIYMPVMIYRDCGLIQSNPRMKQEALQSNTRGRFFCVILDKGYYTVVVYG